MGLIGRHEVVMQVKNQTLDYKFKFTKNKLNSFLRPNIDSWTGRVFLGEQKICDSFLKASKVSNLDEHLVLANMIGDEAVQDFDGSFIKADQERMREEIDDFKTLNNIEKSIDFQEQCLSYVDNLFYETYIYKTKTSDDVVELRFFDDRLQVEKIKFHAEYTTSGSVSIYEKRKEEGASIGQFQIQGLKGDGTLSSESIVIQDSPTESDHNFAFSDDSDDFARASMFYWADVQLKFYENLGYSNYLEVPIKIVYPDRTSTDNGSYSPAVNDEMPVIAITEGETYLKNLGFDEDVISHEIGHHVIYEFLYQLSTTPETLLLHEALADFFVHARTGDTCLGESICQEPKNGASLCYFVSEIESKPSCLRYAEVSFKYEDSVYKELSGAHLKSQLVSSLLNKISKGMNSGEVEVLAYEALKLLPPNANVELFILSLFYSDQEKFNSDYREIIREAAIFYGLSQFVSSIPANGAGDLPDMSTVDVEQSSGNDTESQTKVVSKKVNKPWWHFGCSISSETPTQASGSSCVLLAVMLLPGLFIFRADR